MMHLPEFIFSCVLTTIGGGDVPVACQTLEVVKDSAAAIAAASTEHGVPGAIIAAVIFHESKFDPRAVGYDGLDLGLMQVRRGGAIPTKLAKLSDRALQNIRLNVAIGTAYLGRMMRACPMHFLSRYNGRGCRPSGYQTKVLAGLWMVQTALASNRETDRHQLGRTSNRRRDPDLGGTCDLRDRY
jgi:hypothetical protein